MARPRKEPVATWYQAFKGSRTYLPKSERQGVALAQQKLAPIQATIAYLFGQLEGDRESLRDGVMALSKGEPIICESCKESIWEGGHQEECNLARQYTEVLTTEPGLPR